MCDLLVGARHLMVNSVQGNTRLFNLRRQLFENWPNIGFHNDREWFYSLTDGAVFSSHFNSYISLGTMLMLDLD